jgi:transposase-like protein
VHEQGENRIFFTVTLSMTDMAALTGQDDLVATTASNPGESGSERPKRRTFTTEYKLAILEEYEQATTATERGALLRRERLHTSHICEWRKARRGGALKALEAGKRKPARSAAEIENEKLRKEKEKLARELAQTKAALEIVGKAHALLEMLSESADSDSGQPK